MNIGFKSLLTSLGNFPWQTVARYFGEFAIVFVGVYLAFVLTDYQEELREREVRVRYYDSLIKEFRSLVGHLDVEEQKLLKHLAVVDEIEQGLKPIIPVSDLQFWFRDGIVNVAFEGRNFEALDTGILSAIVTGRPAIEAIDKQVDVFNLLTAELLPIQMADEDCCYDEAGSLVPLLEWYPRITREIYGFNRQLRMVLIEKAIPDLEEFKQALE
ncbi:MAG: hypothetical protein OXG24_06980 [Gammaproteobacteria bacterium]|nr:hypothetical protein [Gammaproteobacteria bacterium]